MRAIRGTVFSLLCAALMLGLAGCTTASRMEVVVNGKRLAVRPELKDNRVYVPAASLAEAMGLTMKFNPQKPWQGVWLWHGKSFLHLHPDANDCHVGTETVRTVVWDAPSLYFDPRTNTPMAPVELVSEAFGAKVEFQSRTATKPARVLVTWRAG